MVREQGVQESEGGGEGVSGEPGVEPEGVEVLVGGTEGEVGGDGDVGGGEGPEWSGRGGGVGGWAGGASSIDETTTIAGSSLGSGDAVACARGGLRGACRFSIPVRRCRLRSREIKKCIHF